ncbi:hypothetical protein HYALB_00008286 [Hymenoscyphus albidus]|uniref:S-adenosyl-L-methionine-dependent methyltransferase n=1 Tax=Hymenoscyphus albidus TaxID=595503 RepID=A0A9N9Q3D2_9HELO|nr:hypothetical protein HYALB_00008286 [Hymenoscyphus albidus]
MSESTNPSSVAVAAPPESSATVNPTTVMESPTPATPPENTTGSAPAPAVASAAPAVAAAQPDIEADEIDALEGDSAFGDDASEEHGRRYHAYRDGKYLIPNDETEQDRLDLHHHVFNLAFDGKLVHAPIKNPSRVLDAGTGTGIWAIDFADQYPEAHIIGSDLSPIQPGWIPPNLEFEVDDLEDTWRHKPFSYIHIRSLAGSIKDWPRLLSQALTHLEPGGYLEVVEFEVLLRIQNEHEIAFPPMIKKWQEGLHQAGEAIGRSFDIAPRLKDMLSEAGYVGVHGEVTRVPNSPWAKEKRWKELGLYQQHQMLDATSSYGQAHFTRVLGWSKQEFDVMSACCRRELKDLRYHTYSDLYVCYGQRPL